MRRCTCDPYLLYHITAQPTKCQLPLNYGCRIRNEVVTISSRDECTAETVAVIGRVSVLRVVGEPSSKRHQRRWRAGPERQCSTLRVWNVEIRLEREISGIELCANAVDETGVIA